jgi:hypothetical protein
MPSSDPLIIRESDHWLWHATWAVGQNLGKPDMTEYIPQPPCG